VACAQGIEGDAQGRKAVKIGALEGKLPVAVKSSRRAAVVLRFG